MLRRRALAAVVVALGLGAGCGDGGVREAENDRPQQQEPNPQAPAPRDHPSSDAAERYNAVLDVGADPASITHSELARPFVPPSGVVRRSPPLEHLLTARVVARDVVIVEFYSAAPPCDGVGGVDAVVDRDVVTVTIQPVFPRVPAGAPQELCLSESRVARIAITVPGAAVGMRVVTPSGAEAEHADRLRPGWEQRAMAPTRLEDAPRPMAPDVDA